MKTAGMQHLKELFVKRLFLSDALDSKLIRVGDYHQATSEELYLRLRLQFLMLILFGRKLYVTEGWALDSVPFIKVAGEAIAAMNALRDDGHRSDALAKFSPIVMEKRRDGNFREVFQSYADRKDIRWSGFMPHSESPEAREFIAAQMRSAANMPVAIDKIFSEFVPNSYFARDMAYVAEYFSRPSTPESIRMLRVNPPPAAFSGSFAAFLRKAAGNARSDNPVHAALARAAGTARAEGMSFSTSSLAMQFAGRQEDPQVRDALMRAINVAYMKVSSDAAGAQMVTPAHLVDTVDEENDRLVVASLPDSRHDHDLFFVRGYEGGHDLSAKLTALGAEDWRPIWKKAILLALDEDWKQAVRSFSQVLELHGYSVAIESPSYQRLESLLNKNIPELVISYSPAARIFGFRGSEQARKKFSNIAGATIGTFIGAIALLSLKDEIARLTLAAGAGTYATVELGKSIFKENFPDKFNLLSDKGLGAKRSSILDRKMRR
jgi:hypothetical protein